MIAVFEEITAQGTDLQTAVTKLLALDKPFPKPLVERIKKDDVFARLIYKASTERELIPSILLLNENHNNTTPKHSNTQLIKKGASAIVEWGAGGFQFADKELVNKRKALCNACPYLTQATNQLAYKLKLNRNEDTSICSSCGCIIARKVRLPKQVCPQGKW